MLAYVFWHWRRLEVRGSDYAESLAAFHHALSLKKPPGLRHSVTFRVGGAPWLPADRESYEDWYLTDGSAALDPLNDAAVAGTCAAPHDAVARAAAGGVGGLYRLKFGGPEVSRSRVAFWFAKPAGVSYTAVFTRMNALAARAAAGLWMRQMVLGPAPEFCLAIPALEEPPAGIGGVLVERELVWSEV